MLNGEISMLKEKNKSINSCINEKINTINNQHKYFEINNKVYKDIKGYIQEKETILKNQVNIDLYSAGSHQQHWEQCPQSHRAGICKWKLREVLRDPEEIERVDNAFQEVSLRWIRGVLKDLR